MLKSLLSSLGNAAIFCATSAVSIFIKIEYEFSSSENLTVKQVFLFEISELSNLTPNSLKVGLFLSLLEENFAFLILSRVAVHEGRRVFEGAPRPELDIVVGRVRHLRRVEVGGVEAFHELLGVKVDGFGGYHLFGLCVCVFV